MTVERDRKLHLIMPLGTVMMMLLASLACLAETNDLNGFNLRRNYQLESGELLSGEQVVMAYQIDLKEGSGVDGDLTLTGNKVSLAGTVNGDVVVVADQLRIGDSAHVSGDLVICVKDLNRREGAQVDGEIREECNDSSRVSVANLIESGWDAWRSGWLYRLSSSVIGSLMFGALAALCTVLFPSPLVRMSETIQRAPFATGTIGCLTILMAIGLTAVYGISLLLILPIVLLPFVVVAWLIVGMFSVLGWVALAEPFGIYLFRLLGASRQPRMINAAIGAIVLALLLRVWSIFWFTAWIGLLATTVLGSIGLGAVLLTRIGTKPYSRPALPASRQRLVQ
jgi:hypothetical protein